MSLVSTAGYWNERRPGAEIFLAGWDHALGLAWESFRAGTTPVGAVVVSAAGSVVAAGRGRRYEPSGPPGQLADAHIAHAEINALAQLSSDRHWEDHCLLTTLEPCGMCHGAAIQASVGALMFAGLDPYGGTATLRFASPQSARRSLVVAGPLTDARGVFATLLHLVWLMQKGGADHIIALHQQKMPKLSAYARDVQPDLLTVSAADDYTKAFAIAEAAP